MNRYRSIWRDDGNPGLRRIRVKGTALAAANLVIAGPLDLVAPVRVPRALTN
jgi:hypothetical protein